MKVLVCGGRDFMSPTFVWEELDRLHAEHHFTALMQGGARGVDAFAQKWATMTEGIQRFVCKADWDTHGRSAGPIRNARMLEWKPDFVIAFPGKTGTADMVKRARAAGINVIVIEAPLGVR